MAERKKKKSEMPADVQATSNADLKRQYEAMFLFPPGDADAAVALARGFIEKHAGEVILIKKWDERKLTYEIKRQKRGLYIIAYFNAPGAAIGQIERDVNLSEEALRVMITDASHLNQQEMEAVEPQPIAPPREERPSWDRGGYGDRPDRGDRRPRREEATEGAARE